MINVGDLLAILRLQDELSPALDTAIATLQKTEKQAQSTSYQITLLGRGARELGTLMSAAITVPFIAATEAVSEFGGNFESEMTKVVTLAGATRQEVDSLRGGVLKLAGETAQAPEQLAQGLFTLESYGLSGAKAMETLDVATRMSAIGMGTTEANARGLTGVLFSFREQNLSAAAAGDLLAATVKLGNIHIDSLVPAMARVNSVASSMGVKFEDIAAAIATFTHAGVSADVASTGMRAILSSILQDSVKTEKGFRALALATGDNTISMANFRKEMKEKGLTEAMVDLANNVRKAGDAGVSAFAQIIPNIRGLTESFGVYLDNGGMVLDLHEKLLHSTGTIKNGMEETAKTWNFQWAQMKVEVEKVWIALGDAGLLDAFKTFTGFLRDDVIPVLKTTIDLFAKLPAPVKDFAFVMIALTAAVGPFLLFAGQLLMAIGNLARGWGALKLAMGIGEAAGAASGGAGIAGIITAVGSAAMIAIPWIIGIGAALTIAYEAWKLYHENAERASSDQKQLSVDAINLGRIEAVAGQHFKDLGEAIEWARSHIPALQQHSIALTQVLKQAGEQAKATGVQYMSLTDRVAALTDEQKQAITKYHEEGLTVSEIAKEMQHYTENVNVSSEVVGVFLRQTAQSSQEIKKQRDALREIAGAGKTWQETIAKMNPDIVAHAEANLRAGIAQSTVAAAYRLTATEMRAVVELHKAEIESFKTEEAQLNSITKTWEQYQAAVNAGIEDTLSKKLAAIDIAAQREIEALSRTAAFNQTSVNNILMARDQLKANLEKQNLEADENSRAHWEKIAVQAQAAFENANKSSGQFSTEYLQHLRDIADQARITADTFASSFEAGAARAKSAIASIKPPDLGEGTGPGGTLGFNQNAFSIGGINRPWMTPPNLARAEGGPVEAGRSYMVGEQGPELFQPRSSGNIVPNGQLGNTTIHINMSGLLLANNQGAKEDMKRYITEIISDGMMRSRKVSVVK